MGTKHNRKHRTRSVAANRIASFVNVTGRRMRPVKQFGKQAFLMVTSIGANMILSEVERAEQLVNDFVERNNNK
jgi:hypothetical protein